MRVCRPVAYVICRTAVADLREAAGVLTAGAGPCAGRPGRRHLTGRPATVVLCGIACTHGLFAAGALDRLAAQDDVAEIVCTNTVPVRPADGTGKLTVLSVAPALAVCRPGFSASVKDSLPVIPKRVEKAFLAPGKMPNDLQDASDLLRTFLHADQTEMFYLAILRRLVIKTVSVILHT